MAGLDRCGVLPVRFIPVRAGPRPGTTALTPQHLAGARRTGQGHSAGRGADEAVNKERTSTTCTRAAREARTIQSGWRPGLALFSIVGRNRCGQAR